VIDNAITHNHDGGWIRIATTADRATALPVVENGRRVLYEKRVALLAQPFQRLDAARAGFDNGSRARGVDRRGHRHRAQKNGDGDGWLRQRLPRVWGRVAPTSHRGETRRTKNRCQLPRAVAASRSFA
jgi:hypothetical protein